jgi:hypothetical protein
LTVALIVGALAGATALVPNAGGGGRAPDTGTTAHFVRGQIVGSVNAVQRGSRLRGQVHLSLHGLKTDAPHRVRADTRSCGRASGGQDGDTDGNDFLVWRVVARPALGRTDMFGSTRVRLAEPLGETRSIRVLDVSERGNPRQLACISVDVWEHA